MGRMSRPRVDKRPMAVAVLSGDNGRDGPAFLLPPPRDVGLDFVLRACQDGCGNEIDEEGRDRAAWTPYA